MKKSIVIGLSVILTLLGTYYFQVYSVVYFDNGFFRWSLGLAVNAFLFCLVVMSILKDRTKFELKAWERTTGVFRIYKGNQAYVEGWLVPANYYLKEMIDKDLVGYIPLHSKTGKPQYMSSYSVDHIEFLFSRKLPKYEPDKLKIEDMSQTNIFDPFNEGLSPTERARAVKYSNLTFEYKSMSNLMKRMDEQNS